MKNFCTKEAVKKKAMTEGRVATTGRTSRAQPSGVITLSRVNKLISVLLSVRLVARIASQPSSTRGLRSQRTQWYNMRRVRADEHQHHDPHQHMSMLKKPFQDARQSEQTAQPQDLQDIPRGEWTPSIEPVPKL